MSRRPKREPGRSRAAAPPSHTTPASPARAAAPPMAPVDVVALAALIALALVLFLRAFTIGWIADDYLFLDAVRRFPLAELLTGRHAIQGYYRPVSRELYFWVGDSLFGLSAGALHGLNALVFAATAALVFDLTRRWVGVRAAWIATALFVVFPAGGALLAWVSCAQDLIALGLTLGALAFAARGRDVWTAPVVFLAALSKETAWVAPLLLVAADLATRPGPWRDRVRRLLPGFAGLAAALAVTAWARSTWPAANRAGAWSPAQLGAAWRLPFDFLHSWWPPDTPAGFAAVWSTGAWRLPVVILLAAFAVPAVTRGARGSTTPRSAVLLGLALTGIALLPVALVAERWRGYYFVFAAVGASLLAASWLAHRPVWFTRAVVAMVALVHLGSNAVYRPVEEASGAARHPYANIAFFAASAGITDALLGPLEPSCDALRSASRLFTIGVPNDLLFRTTLGPALRVTCRDTALVLRPLSDFRAADAARPFGVVRWLARDQRLAYEPANALTLARIGEGFLLEGRYEEAAACFDGAVAALPAERELTYPHVLSLAAAGQSDRARSLWAAARADGRAPAPDTLLARFLYGITPARRDSAHRVLAPLVAAAVHDPADADAASELGRALLALGLTRQATIALSVAAGIAHRPADLVWLAEALEAGNEPDAARTLYIRALGIGLPRDLFTIAKNRLIVLGPVAPSDSTAGASAAPAPENP
jgi:tetratricopeptide (TPR) repeat protein